MSLPVQGVKMMKKITIVGGSGFVGTNLCQALHDHQIPFEIIDMKPSMRFPNKCKIADTRDLQSLRATITGDIVVLLAAVHRDDIRDQAEYYRTNVVGAENIATVCSEKNIRKIIFTSSVAVYGFAEPGTDEAGSIKPFNAYGRSKHQAEEKLLKWHASGDKELIIVRPTVIFGEGNRGNVHNLFWSIANNKFIMIGSGKNQKSMAYVGNVTAFLEQCIKAQVKYAVFNYVDTPDLDINTLVGKARKVLKGKGGIGLRIPYWAGLALGYGADLFTFLTGKKLPLSSIRVRKFAAVTTFSSAKDKLDNFKPPLTLREGIERTLKAEFISPDPNREIFFTE